MKKNKLGLSVLALGTFGLLLCSPSERVSPSSNPLLKKDTTFLVSLKGSVKTLGEDGVKASQNEFTASLREKIGFNFEVLDTYDAINVMKIKANSAVKDALKASKNAEFVSINKLYRFGDTFTQAAITKEEKAEGFLPYDNSNIVLAEDEGDENVNQSAETMRVPANNKGGEGAFVAILDSGYYLGHEVFSKLEGSAATNKRFSYSDLLAKIPQLKAQPAKTLDPKDVTDSYQSSYVKDISDGGKFEYDGTLYWNNKVPFYYDYGGNYDNSENGFDAYGYASEHGSHVASIASANAPDYKGIAPNSQLALMKVFKESFPTDENPNRSASTGASDDDITEALNDCLVLGVDALNMSLGSDLDDFRSESTAFAVLSKLEEAGCSCNISAGNGGKGLYNFMNGYKHWSTSEYDTGVLGSYATTTDTNIIGSSTTPKQYYEKAIDLNEYDDEGNVTGHKVVGYSDQVDYTDGRDGVTRDKERLLAKVLGESADVELVTAGVKDASGNFYGQDSDYQKVLSEDPNFFKGKIAVCDRGNTTFAAKAAAAQEAGAAALIVINNDPTAYEFTFGMSWGSENEGFNVPEIPVVFVLYRDRDFILNKACKPVILNDKEVCAQGRGKIVLEKPADNPDAYKMSDFSSEGASSNLDIIPTISTPGSSIKGAVPGKANSKGKFEEPKVDSYAYLNGTSMSCPNYTGIVALMVGERDYATEEERVNFLKSLPMRTMSTSRQYSIETTVYSELEEKIGYKESDTKKEDPITIYVPTEGSVTTEESIYSPRKQGAGVVDASKAINSKLYLEGLVPNENGEYGDEHVGNGFGKIELKNNDLINEGKIKLGLRIHNEELISGKTYKVTIKAMTSQVSAYHNHDNELPNYATNDVIFEGGMIQTADTHLLEEIEAGNVTLTGEETQDVILDTKEINAESKKYLENFENGNFLEGYVYLSPVGEEESDENPTLSMPFMGFYGDYTKAAAVEPFTFEREATYNRKEGVTDGHIYGSALVNYVGKYSYALNNIDVSSDIAAVSYDSFQTFDRKTNVSKNDESLGGFSENVTIEEDPLTGEYTIYVGSDRTDVLYISQYVNRSISKANVTLFDKFGNKVAGFPKSITDIIRGTNTLFKSHIAANYIGSKQLAHRGYLELPLYDANGVKIANGEYKLQFDYTLLYGQADGKTYTQTKTYNLVLDGNAPKLTYRGIFDVNGVKVLRFKFEEVYIDDKTKVVVNSSRTSFEMHQVSDGYLIDIPYDDSSFIEGKLLIGVEDAAHNSFKMMINKNEASSGLALISNKLVFASTYSYEEKVINPDINLSKEYTISAKDAYGANLDLGEYEALITFEKPINANRLKAYAYDESGERTTSGISLTVLDSQTVIVKTRSLKFLIQDTGTIHDETIMKENAYVTINQKEQGTIYVDKASGKAGDKATIYVVTKDGYEVEKVMVNGVEVSKNSEGNYTFVMQNGNNVVEVTYKAK